MTLEIESSRFVFLSPLPSRDLDMYVCYRSVYSTVESSIRSGGPLRGTGMWLLTCDGYASDDPQVRKNYRTIP